MEKTGQGSSGVIDNILVRISYLNTSLSPCVGDVLCGLRSVYVISLPSPCTP